MNGKFLNQFRKPPSEYRGAPFWAWNGKLEPEELRRQIRIMHRMGLGGFFMHSRVGLDTAYLSDDWFECVEACIDEAARLGMKAWLYDEDRWPSGAAGGLVTSNPKHRQRMVAMDQRSSAAGIQWGSDILAMFIAKVDGPVATDVRRVAKGKRPGRLAAGESLLVFRVETAGCSSWYNGQTYLDTLSHEAVAEFIQVTHEAYRKRIANRFGDVVPGIFTDEPNYGAVCLDAPDWAAIPQDGAEASVSSPWTPKLPKVFRERYGYNLLPRLVELFLDVDGRPVSRARYHYLDCITHLFADAFSRQIGQWCEANNIQLTGHVLLEGAPSMQTFHGGGGCMRFYEHMQAPGMDLLTEHSREYDTAKQVSSAARQFGRTWRLTETYGCTGWDFPFAAHKALGDWQAALGINLRCQHLSWYTMEGQAKRDYPAGIFYQSPWWELYGKVEDYFGRIHVAMTQGREVRDLLVIHPNESTWTLVRKGWMNSPKAKAIDRMIVELRDSLLTAGIDFDYGDEEILSRKARVSRGKTPVLRVGKAEYRAVIVPPLVTIRRTTLRLLKRFHAAGGKVVFAGRAPGYVDAVESDAAAAFASQCTRAPAKGPKLVAAVEREARRVAVTDSANEPIAAALHLLREDADAFYLFVCNTSLKPGQIRPTNHDPTMVRDRVAAFEDVRIRGFAGCKGAPVELVPDSGDIVAAEARPSATGWEIRTSLPALGSRIFVIPKRRSAKRTAPRRTLKDVRSVSLGSRKTTWNVALSEANALVLDRPRYRIGRGRWRKPTEILKVDYAVRDAMGIPRRGGRMVQPWAKAASDDPKRTTVQLEYTFDVRTIPSGDLRLAIERPETFEVAVNGAAICTDAESGWWCDRSLRTLPIDPSTLRIGANRIELTCAYTEDHPGLEIAYLLGDFGVRVRGTQTTITAAPTALKIGDWTTQGLPFYSGAVAYRRTLRPALRKGQRLFVHVPGYRGVAVRVIVNGREAGVIAWEPNEVEITHLLGDGPADLRIEVISHRRNSHGPLHLNEKWPRWTGPGQFVTEGDQWRETYQLAPCGLTAPPQGEPRWPALFSFDPSTTRGPHHLPQLFFRMTKSSRSTVPVSSKSARSSTRGF